MGNSISIPFADVQVVNRTEQLGALGLMGPEARTVLGTLADAHLDAGAFPWLSARTIQVGPVEALALYLSDRVVIITPRPGRVLAEIAVPFERPRDEGHRTLPEFSALRHDIYLRLKAAHRDDDGAPGG